MKRTARWLLAALLMFGLFHYKIDVTPAQLINQVDDHVLVAWQQDDDCCKRSCDKDKKPLNDQVLAFLQRKWS